MRPDAREALWRQGFLVGDRSRICSPDFVEPYRWMACRMKERLPSPPSGVESWPLWAWSRWNDLSAPDPHAEEYAGQELWIVGFDARPQEVLLSCFHAWHHVLNGWYLPDLRTPDEGEAEAEAFDAELAAAGVVWIERPWPSPFRERSEASWNRVFDVRQEDPDVQATFWQLDASCVVSEIPAGRLTVTRPVGRR